MRISLVDLGTKEKIPPEIGTCEISLRPFFEEALEISAEDVQLKLTEAYEAKWDELIPPKEKGQEGTPKDKYALISVLIVSFPSRIMYQSASGGAKMVNECQWFLHTLGVCGVCLRGAGERVTKKHSS